MLREYKSTGEYTSFDADFEDQKNIEEKKTTQIKKMKHVS